MNKKKTKIPRYIITTVSGLESAAEREIKQGITDIKVLTKSSGLLAITTSAKPSTIRRFRFINNAFLCLNEYQETNTTNLLQSVKNVMPHVSDLSRLFEFVPKTFRIVVSHENEIIRPDQAARNQLEHHISQSTKLSLDIHEADIEFWLIIRREGFSFWTIRLTRTRHKTHPGELRPELANMMGTLAHLNKSDVVLDPFCGFGAIPFEIVRNFAIQECIAFDKDPQTIHRIQLTATHERLPIKAQTIDIQQMSLPDRSIDAVITDPPWGMFHQLAEGVDEFYRVMIEQCARVLKTEGRLVLLTGAKEIASKLLNESDQFVIKEQYDILVSGQKAILIVAVRK
ncbi:methyltransferase [candidate division WWE3 bacterium]|nr:methyltransferase [candidate division WWE3 bacterium]